jgi:hypothetical protein
MLKFIRRSTLVGFAGAALLASGVAPSLAVQQPESPSFDAPVQKWMRGGCEAGGCDTGWYSSPVIVDLDRDGTAEVIWGAYDVVSIDGATGTTEWRATNGQRVWPGVAVADLTGDGTLEVIAGRGGDQLTVYNAAGGTVWTRNPFGGGEVRTLAVADLENDGQLEIVVGRASSGGNNQLSVYEPDGSVRPGWPARRTGEPGFGAGMYNENVTVGDLNGDGFREIIGPTDTHYITSLDRGGNQLMANAIYGANKVWSQVGVHVDHSVDLVGFANCGVEHRPNFANCAPAIADVNLDGVFEMIVPGDVYNCAIGDNEQGDLYVMPWILNVDRTRWSGSGFNWTAIPTPPANAGPLSEDFNIIENNVHNAVVVDLDGDGFREILFPSYDGRLHAYWLDKTQHGSWPYDIPGAGIRFASEPAIVDLDNDGDAEVILTSWPEKAGNGVGHLHILDHLGNQLFAPIALPASFPAGDWNGGLAAPAVGNIDGDADIEIVVGTSSSGCVAYDVGNSANARILWSTGRGGPLRSGVNAVGTDTPGIYIPSTGSWFVRNASSPGGANLVYGYGPAGLGWVPVSGDFTGNGVASPGLYDPSTGNFFLRIANSPGGANRVFGFGAGGAGYIPLVGDWNGDGLDTIGLYNPASGAFFLRNANASGGADIVFFFGPGGNQFLPISGDWNGDGRDTVGIYAPSTGTFFLKNTNTPGGADLAFSYGPPNATPLAGDWNADRIDSVGIYIPGTGTWFLRNSNSAGPANLVFSYGPANATPLVGSWDGQ